MTTTILHTERLTLRPLTLDDALALLPIYQDAETMRFMPTPPLKNARAVRTMLQQDMRRSDAHHWAICLRGSDTPIGIVNFLGETRLPGMGYILHRDWWGQGITPEACRAALGYGFAQLGYDRVELWIDERNVASQQVARKLNFGLKGRLPLKYPHRDKQHIMLVFGLWAHEWQGQLVGETAVRFFRAEPILSVVNVLETAVYYRDQLGFHIDFLYGNPPIHAAVSRGNWSGSLVAIQLSQAAPDQPPAPSTLYINVDTAIDTLHDQYRQNGVTIINAPTTHPWGMREFAIQDPNGHTLRFGTQA